MTFLPVVSKLTLLQRQMVSHLGAASSAGTVVFTSSLSKEDQIISWSIVDAGLPIEIVTLDTGYLFPQTEALVALTEKMLDVRIRRLTPDSDAVDAFEGAPGMKAIYQSVEARKQCCSLRKLAPLKKEMEGRQWWVTGLRRAQSPNRAGLEMVERDDAWGVCKYHPMLDWTDADVDAVLPLIEIPVNPLHAEGYPSIGCAPCTRAVAPGDHPRTGRWWWESSTKECGLHSR
jgi:phosphoadenosine phosphosulfate reductase